MFKQISYQLYISIGLVLNGIAYLFYEQGLINHSMRLGLLILMIVFEMIGLIKWKKDEFI